MSYFIKVWDTMIENEIWQNDPTAWRIFEYLLIRAYQGKPQGKVVTSRYQIAERVGGNNNTIYKALKRLEKAKMVTIRATNKKSTISICNWSKYQGNGNYSGNNQVTTKEQQSNTLIKNKDIRVKKLSLTKVNNNKPDKRNPEVTQLISQFETRIGKTTRDQSYAAITLLKQHGLEETLGAINAAAAARGQPYAPSIASLEELLEKWIKLENFVARKLKPKGVKIT